MAEMIYNGESELTGVIQMKVDNATRWINDKIRANVHQTYLEIGNYVFEQFFDGDIDQVKSLNPQKELSFKKLSERKDLLMSKVNLYRSVQVAIQERQLLPTVSAMKQLTFTHKVALLPLKSINQKQELAELAAQEKLSTRQLQRLVSEAKENTPGSKAGRPSLPGFMKTIRKSYKLFSEKDALASLTDKALDCLDENDAIELRIKIKNIRNAINQVDEVLKRVIIDEKDQAPEV